MQVLDRTDIEPSRRLCGDEYARVPAIHLARGDDLLLIAAGERPGLRLRIAPAYVELLEEPLSTGSQDAREQPAEAGVWPVAEIVERDVLSEREVEHEPVAMPILGDVTDARLEHAAYARMQRRRLPSMTILPLSRLRRPEMASINSVWPLPSTPAIPTISPART